MSQNEAEGTPKRRMDFEVLGFGLLIIIGGLMVAYDGASLKLAPSYARIGPQIVPYITGAGLILVGALISLYAVKGPPTHKDVLSFPPIVWILGGLLAQAGLLHVAGFSIATGCLFAATARAFGRRPIWLNLIIGIVFSFILYAIFQLGLQLSLPAGWLENLIQG